MALTTVDDKLAIMEWDIVWEPGLIISEASPFDQGDKQQLLLGLPDPVWGDLVVADDPSGLIKRIAGGNR